MWFRSRVSRFQSKFQSHSQRQSRGAVAVEAVAVVSFFVLMFALMAFVSGYYAQKQYTLRVSKEQAWMYAMKNCKEAYGNASHSESPESSMSDVESTRHDVDTSSADELSGGDSKKETETLSKKWGTASATVSSSVKVPAMLHGFSGAMSSTTTAQCNEVPQNGNLLGVLKYAWENKANW